MTETSQGLRRWAAAAMGATGLLHLILAPEYMGEQAYVGALFVLGGITAIAIAIRLWVAEDARAWALGALVAAGMAVGFVLSRTVGLPGFHESEWELSGIISLLLEGGFLGLFAASRRAPARLAATA